MASITCSVFGLLVTACATSTEDDAAPSTVAPAASTVPLAPASTAAPPTASPSPAPVVSSSPTMPPTTVPAPPATPAPTAAPPSTAGPTTTMPTTPAPPVSGVSNPPCVRAAGPDDSLEQIATQVGAPLDLRRLWAENDFPPTLAPGELVDVCVDNAVDDVTGDPRPAVDDATIDAAEHSNVERQQTKLNELFAPFGTTPLAVDGDSGPRTGQRLCAARLALGLPTSIADMPAGSQAQAVLLAAAQLPTPASSAVGSPRWALIDRTCQMMFVGSGDSTVFVFPTSTGSAGFETRDQDRARVFRYNPATENGGWHNSSEFPVGVDNPLNGNLWKPLYFDYGQAIHGANNVPPTPESKGCARLSLADQATLLTWLGLLELTEETWLKDRIDLTVNVQGTFIPR